MTRLSNGPISKMCHESLPVLRGHARGFEYGPNFDDREFKFKSKGELHVLMLIIKMYSFYGESIAKGLQTWKYYHR